MAGGGGEGGCRCLYVIDTEPRVNNTASVASLVYTDLKSQLWASKL